MTNQPNERAYICGTHDVSEAMKAKVTEHGVQVPKRLLGEAEEVEIRQENGNVVVVPLLPEEDPIWDLGSRPVACGASDASEAHDRYLYGRAE